jgi:NADH-quinone oxidoreductase subunit G
MVELEIDGKKIEVLEGSMVMHAAEKLGTYIPHFCYHKKLSIAANCRMCLVDVEKAPKAMPACATPVTQGMIVRTKSEKATKAQKSVMEFLLINHPLDCPICDQGGECQLQDLAVGYGGSSSRYEEEKRVVFHKDIGPLISMQEMSRCIHCTRCVRFGQEIAGQMELGMSHRGEHAEIEAFVGQTVDSELSGNMIDVCPVGALTSKPFRYQARTWELSRRKTISPHDSTGANLIAQVKNNQVLRIVPLENEAINECWIADRDRFSYEALSSDQRLTSPMIKQDNVWRSVDWQTALEYIAHGVKHIQKDHGQQSIGLLASPHSTLEELYLGGKLIRALGSENIDSRLRQRDFSADKDRPSTPQAHWLGRSIESLSQLQRLLVVGSNLRKDHPLLALRIRQATRRGAQVNTLNAHQQDWAMPLKNSFNALASTWVAALGLIAESVAKAKGVQSPVAVLSSNAVMNELLGINPQALIQATHIAESLLGGDQKAVLLGNACAHHPQATSLLALANWIGEQTGASVGFLSEAANTVGAQLVGAVPTVSGLNTRSMIESDKVKALFILGNEPVFDCADGAKTTAHLAKKDMIISMNAFKANMEFSDVLLPIAPFTETPGTFVNAQGLAQSFHAVVRPLADTRPAWKVLRVLANVLGLSGFEYETIEELRADALPKDIASHLNNASFKDLSSIDLSPSQGIVEEDLSVGIYGLDSLVRRSHALQHTVDAQLDPRFQAYAAINNQASSHHDHTAHQSGHPNTSIHTLKEVNAHV